jgi:serine/threonine protein kinase/tetratricopeptide (TPR) repeat protein
MTPNAPQTEIPRPQPGGAEDTRARHDGEATIRHPGPLRRGTLPAAGAPTSPTPPRNPDWAALAGYEVLDELGRGSMGVVYKARQVALDRLVALKTLQDGLFSRQEGLDRFISEARVVARLQHPNIVQVFEISLQRDLPFFAMELVEGGNLATWLGGRPQPFADAARLARTLARAIHAAHEQGIVHRDLKPGNVLMSRRTGCQPVPLPEGQAGSLSGEAVPKITDFGLAKQIEGDSALTQSGVILGTPNYMAPEQARGSSRDVGPAADIYALGAILYEMLTGRPPHNAESPAETVLQLFQLEPVAPSKLRSRLPRDLETICLKCLQKDPARRYASAAELADDLERYLDGAPILARPAPWREKAWKWAKRRPAPAALAGCAVAGLLVFLGSLVYHERQLRHKLAEARLEEQQARDAQELLRQRGEVEDLLRQGDAALAKEDWRAAVLHLGHARDRLGADGKDELADLRQRCGVLLERATRQRQERERLTRFRAAREQALFEATLFTGSDLQSAREQARRSAAEALAVYGIVPGKPIKLTLDSPYLKDAERREVLVGCYELLVMQADAVAAALGAAPRQPWPVRARRAEEALDLLDQAEALGVETRALRQRRASYLAHAGDDAAAATAAQRAARTPPAGALDHFLLGEELLRKGDAPAATAAFERALQEQPGHFWAQCYLGLSWLRRQRPDLAAQALTACIGQRPDFTWLYLLRGAARGEVGQHGPAETDFALAEKRGLSEPQRYVLYNQRGVLRVRQGRADDAIRDLREAVRLRPAQYQAHVNLAQAYLKASRLDDAVAALDQAIALEPNLASLYRTRAQVQMLRQQDAAALVDLDAALALSRGAPAAVRAADHLLRARLLLRREDQSAALAACGQALELQPDVQVYRLQAEVLLALGRHADAAAALDACLERQPRDAGLLCARASLRTRLGDYAGAQTDYGRALEVAAAAETFAARGWTYLLTNTPRLALEDFEQALRRDAAHGDALMGRAQARVLLGQTDPALADARAALRVGPRSSRLSYNAARVYAQAVLRAEKRSGSRGREGLSREGVALLDDALSQLPAKERAEFWHSRVLADPTLHPLRSHPGFQRLAARYPAPPVTE